MSDDSMIPSPTYVGHRSRRERHRFSRVLRATRDHQFRLVLIVTAGLVAGPLAMIMAMGLVPGSERASA
jgi:hypothetical protein